MSRGRPDGFIGGPARCNGRNFYKSAADARLYHYGTRHKSIVFQECWHHCPKCGKEWFHIVECKTAVGPWRRVHARLRDCSIKVATAAREKDRERKKRERELSRTRGQNAMKPGR